MTWMPGAERDWHTSAQGDEGVGQEPSSGPLAQIVLSSPRGPMRKPVSKKKTAFVPRGLFVRALATAGVIPLCACGGVVAGTHGDGGTAGVAADAFVASDRPVLGVAVFIGDAGDGGLIATVAACCFDATLGVADASFGVALDAFGGSDVIFSVGVQAFDAGADTGLVHGVPPVAFGNK
jgi:hypothetical protein